MKHPFLLLVISPLLLVGCGAASSSLLPHSRSTSDMPWAGHSDMKRAYLEVKEGETTRVELEQLGFHHGNHPNAKQVDYLRVREILLGERQETRPDELPAGAQECLQARDLCVGLIFPAKKEDTAHVGNFFKDKLGIEEVIKKTGWLFEAQFFVRRVLPHTDGANDVAVFKRSPEDVPNINEIQNRKDPLGPFTNLWGVMTGAAGRTEQLLK